LNIIAMSGKVRAVLGFRPDSVLEAGLVSKNSLEEARESLKVAKYIQEATK
jgi:hypothetical protein